MCRPPAATEMSSGSICVLDLDHTILHMLKRTELPDTDGFAEDVVSFEHEGNEYAVALRVGTTSFVRALRAANVTVVIATCNLVADKVMAALAARNPEAFESLDLHVIESREKGAKSLGLLGIDRRRRVVIVDDSPSAWSAADQDFVLVARKYDARALARAVEADDDDLDEILDQELGYLVKVRDELLAFFDPNDESTAAAAPTSLQRRLASDDAAETSTENPETEDDGAKPAKEDPRGRPNGRRSPTVVAPSQDVGLLRPQQQVSSSSVDGGHYSSPHVVAHSGGGGGLGERPMIASSQKGTSSGGGSHSGGQHRGPPAAEPPRKRSKTHAGHHSDAVFADTLPSHAPSRGFVNGAGPGPFGPAAREASRAAVVPRPPPVSGPPAGAAGRGAAPSTHHASLSNPHRDPLRGGRAVGGFSGHNDNHNPSAAVGRGAVGPPRGRSHHGNGPAPSGFGGLRERPPQPPAAGTTPAAILSQL